MANEALVAAIKDIMGLAKAGKADEAYAAYAQLFASAAFAEYRPEDQRQALKLMVLAKGIPSPTPPTILAAHGVAQGRIQALVDAHKEPQDYEMLGMCQVRAGNEAAAALSFKSGLDIERERDPQSKLCGTLMKLVASV
jgi:hypothetical protein